jgi:hypothetical protein
VEQTQVSPSPTATGADKRRTTRVVQAVPIVVRGLDALGQSFKESTTTVMVNCNGCKYRSRHYVPKDSRVSVEIRSAVQGAPPRVMPAKVVWVQRPRTFREIFHVALEFEVPGNVWGIQDPPEDWFRHPDEDAMQAAVQAEAGAAQSGAADAVRVERHDEFAGQEAASANGEGGSSGSGGESRAPAESTQGLTHGAPDPPHGDARPAHLPVAAAPTPLGASSRAHGSGHHAAGSRHVHADAEEIPDEEWNPQKICTPEVAAARDWLKPAVKAAMSRELSRLRERVQSHMREALGETVRVVTQNLVESVERELVEQAAVSTAEIIVEARKACQGEAGRLNERIRQIVQETLSSQPPHSHQHSDQGSAQSSEQTASQSVGQSSGQSSSQFSGQAQQHFGKKRKKHKKGRFEQQKEPVTTQ